MTHPRLHRTRLAALVPLGRGARLACAALFALGAAQSLGELGVRSGPWLWPTWPRFLLWIFALVVYLAVPQRARPLGLRRAALGAILLALLATIHTCLPFSPRVEPVSGEMRRLSGRGQVVAVSLPSLRLASRDLVRALGRRRDLDLTVEAHLWVPTTGAYDLQASADHGVSLTLDGRVAIEPAASGSVTLQLTRGWHEIALRYRHEGGRAWVRVAWDRPGFWEWLPIEAYLASRGALSSAAPVEGCAALDFALRLILWACFALLLARTAEARASLHAELRHALAPWVNVSSRHTLALLLAANALLVAFLGAQAIEMGSTAGMWVYPPLGYPTLRVFGVAALAIVGVVPLFLFCDRLSPRRPLLALTLALVAGLAVQAGLRTLYPYPLAELVRSDTTNAFYSVAKNHGFLTLLRDYEGLAPSLPQHARANMPGKALLFWVLLRVLGDSPALIGRILLVLTSLNAWLVYAIVNEYFDDRRSAFRGFLLALLIPASMFFASTPNTLSPVPILLALLFFVRSRRRQRWLMLVLSGAMLYATVLFDPSTLPLGLLFVAVLTEELGRGQRRLRVTLVGAAVPLLAFAAIDVVLLHGLGFNLLSAFSFVWRDAHQFNISTQRPYGLWLLANLKEFVINAGFSQSLLWLAALLGLLLGCRDGPVADEAREHRARIMLLTFTATLLVVNLLGINRGEVTRLWIYLAVVLQLVVGERLGRAGRLLLGVVLSAVLLQSALGLATTAFVRDRAIAIAAPEMQPSGRGAADDVP